MQLHTLQRKTKRKVVKRIGRGRASGKGKTSGRGTKGQKARAGHRIRPDVREKLKKLPKLRGYNFASIMQKPLVINLTVLEQAFSAGEEVTPASLAERGLVRAPRAPRGAMRQIKVLGGGALTKKLAVSGCATSASAKVKIEQAGGSVQ